MKKAKKAGKKVIHKKDLMRLREMLLKKKSELEKIIEHKEYGVEVGDDLDVVRDTIEKEILFYLTDNEKLILNDIEWALEKFEKGKYGTCESCGKQIPILRLQAVPWARYCLICQKKFEQISKG